MNNHRDLNKKEREAKLKKNKKLNMTENGIHIYYQCSCGSVIKDKKENKKSHEKTCSVVNKKKFENYKYNNADEYEKIAELIRNTY